jgi:hypothetical protein
MITLIVVRASSLQKQRVGRQDACATILIHHPSLVNLKFPANAVIITIAESATGFEAKMEKES